MGSIGGIYFPDADMPISPLAPHFAALATTVDTRLSGSKISVNVANVAATTALDEGTPFYLLDWKRSGYKTAAAGSVGYKISANNLVKGSVEYYGYSGGGFVPGAATIGITAQTISFTEPVLVEFQVTILLLITNNCAGRIYLDLGSTPRRNIRWHSHAVSGTYSVVGNIKCWFPPGNATGTVLGDSDSGSSNIVTIADISTSLTMLT